MDPVDYVLLDFSPTERPLVDEAIAKVGEAVPFLLKEGLAGRDEQVQPEGITLSLATSPRRETEENLSPSLERLGRLADRV
jgi:hypothetical protein